MWSKISNALKSRSEAEPAPSTQPQQQPHLTSSIMDQTLPAPSPPSSPSKNGRLGLFKRSKSQHQENTWSRKAKGSLHINTNMNGSNVTLPKPTPDSFQAQSATEYPRPFTPSESHKRYASVRSIFNDKNTPPVPQIDLRLSGDDNMEYVASAIDAQRAVGSVRSILRDKNTPGSGQNVRFFSRDAYRVISPDTSTNNSNENNNPVAEPSFMQRLKDMSPDNSTEGSKPTEYQSALTTADLFSSASSNGKMFLGVHSPAVKAKAANDSTKYQRPLHDQANSSMTSLLVTIPPPELSDIFDLSAAQEHNVQSIPIGVEDAIQDGAVEIDEFDEVVKKSFEQPIFTRQTDAEKENRSDYSYLPPITSNQRTTSKTGAVFRPIENIIDDKLEKSSLPLEDHAIPPRSTSSLGLYKMFSKEKEIDGSSSLDSLANASSRQRSQSERASRKQTEERKDRPEAEINDMSSPQLSLGVGGPVDPFHADADARNYYTPDDGVFNSPPKHARQCSGDSRKSSKSASGSSSKSGKSNTSSTSATSQIVASIRDGEAEADVILALRTQIAYHQELAAQYEADLKARDELVSLLNQKMKAVEEENEKRSRATRGMRRKITDLEKIKNSLEDEVERSREEKHERSIMDEASSHALKQLHTKIDLLKREKADAEQRENSFKRENERLLLEVRDCKEGIKAAKEQMEAMQAADLSMERGVEDVRSLIAQGDKEHSLELQRYQILQSEWEEERARLMEKIAAFEDAHDAQENEVYTLKAELEAQWLNTEKMSAKIEELQMKNTDIHDQNEHLKNELSALEARTSDMEVEWTESENKRAELEMELGNVWVGKDELEQTCEELREKLASARTDIEHLTTELESVNARLPSLQQEREFNSDHVARLQELLQERDAEIASYKTRISSKEEEINSLHVEMSHMRREHKREISEQTRVSQELAQVAKDGRKDMEEAVRDRVKFEADANELKERVSSLSAECDNLRRQVHVLRQESADQELKITEMQRQHDLDKEDKLGLNIALESKQTELEMIKRRFDVRGTAGATPAPIAGARTGIRRESVATPVPIRPPSSLSDAGGKSTKHLIETPSTVGKAPALGKSTKLNAIKARLNEATSTSAMGPPRTSSVRVSSLSGAGHRRVSSAAASHTLSSKSALARSQSATVSELSDSSSMQSEKENARPSSSMSRTPRANRRSASVSTPVPA